MADARDHYHSKRKHSLSTVTSSCYNSYLFISLLCFASLFLAFCLFRTSPSTRHHHHHAGGILPSETKSSPSCDYSDGRWIYDPTVRSPRYDNTCKEIYKGWNCLASNKSNAFDIVKWRWKPNHCDLPQFDPLLFLQSYRDTNIGFVGDSLNRNMFVSLFCTLKRVSGEVRKWRPAGADRGFTFLQYNLTIAYHRTNLLARYDGQPMPMMESWNLLGIKRAIELMLIHLKEHGQKLQLSMILSSLIQDTGGGLLQSLTL